MKKILFSGMFSARGRLFLCTLVAVAWIIFGCSDTGKGSDEINIREERANSVSKTNDGHDVLVFQKDELDETLFKIDTTASSEEGFVGKLLFRDLNDENIPQVGDIIASGETTIAEYGFLYKVSGISTENGVTTVEVRSASLEEAIEDVDFESETEFQFDENDNLVGVLQKSSTFGELRLTTPAIPIKVGGVKVGEIKASVAYSMSFNFNISIKDWKLQTVKMTLVQNGDVTLKGTVGSVEGEVKPRPQLASPIPLPSITFFVGLVPVVITNEVILELKIKAEAQAGIEATYTLSGRGEYGFEYRDGGIYSVKDNNFSKTFNFEHQLSGTARIGIIIGLKSKFYGVAGFILGAGPALDLYVGGNPFGTHVFDNGFRGDYTNYRSIWAGTGITDLESGGATINIAINNSGGVATSNFFRTIANEAKLDFGLNFEAAITLDVLGKNLLRHTFAETFHKIATLYRTSFLPLFDDPQVTIVGTGIEVKSQIERDFLNYPVKSYGICIEPPSSNECRNGKGIRWVDNVPIKAGSIHNFTATFNNNLESGKIYAIRPYFSTGLGTYYDKATSFTPYSLTINRNPTTGGTVTYSPEQGSYNHGAQVTIVATANPDYDFTGWSGALTSANPSERITMNSNLALTANFQKRYTLTINQNPTIGGTVTYSPEQKDYSHGTYVTVVATANPDYDFAGWSGALTSTNSSDIITMNSNLALIANFQKRYTLTINQNPTIGGTVTYSPEQENFSHGAQVTVVATANPGYEFAGWSGALTSTNPSEKITMNSNLALTANFRKRIYTLTTAEAPIIGSSIIRTPNKPSYDAGETVVVNVGGMPEEYQFVGWAGASTSKNTTISITMDDDKALIAMFSSRSATDSYTLSTSVPVGGGNVERNPKLENYGYGTQVTVTASPNLYYRFKGWNGTLTSTANPITITMDKNYVLVADFIRTYTLTTNSTVGGTVTGGGTFDTGTNVSIKATPNFGYRFSHWSGDGIANQYSANTTVSMTGEKVVTANFVRTYSLTVNSTVGGTVTGGGTFDAGTNAPITATPAVTPSPGYKFSHWSGDEVANQYSANTTVSMTANKTVTANFVQTYSLTVNSTVGGTVTGSGIFNAGTNAPITATPAVTPSPGYKFSHWSEDEVANRYSANTTVAMTANKMVTANFTKLITEEAIFETSTTDYTFNKGFPVIVEIYALGGGGGGQGGHENVWSGNDGTGGAGGGGAAAYLKYQETGAITFSSIIVGGGGDGGSKFTNLVGSWEGGNSGNSGGSTSVTWNRGTLTVRGGGGAGRATGKQDLSGGGGGNRNPIAWPTVTLLDSETVDGGDGGSGSQNSCATSQGGSAGRIVKNSITFGGGSGGSISSCEKSFWTAGTHYYNASTGGGGTGGYYTVGGQPGGSGQVRIRFTY